MRVPFSRCTSPMEAAMADAMPRLCAKNARRGSASDMLAVYTRGGGLLLLLQHDLLVEFSHGTGDVAIDRQHLAVLGKRPFVGQGDVVAAVVGLRRDDQGVAVPFTGALHGIIADLIGGLAAIGHVFHLE